MSDSRNNYLYSTSKKGTENLKLEKIQIQGRKQKDENSAGSKMVIAHMNNMEGKWRLYDPRIISNKMMIMRFFSNQETP